ncbi:MAG: CBS domain-containing protein [Candidatus Woesebacteria bacterium]|nr:CBS domain-containing protein [Candidatus Woesebacteria bacterium]
MIKTVQGLLRSLPNKKHGLITIGHDANASQFAAVLKDNNVNIVVVTKNGKPVGVISSSDVSNDVADGILGRYASEMMKRDVITVSVDANINDVSKTMTKNNIRHIVVTNNGEWSEILSIKEILDAVTANEQELMLVIFLTNPPTSSLFLRLCFAWS